MRFARVLTFWPTALFLSAAALVYCRSPWLNSTSRPATTHLQEFAIPTDSGPVDTHLLPAKYRRLIEDRKIQTGILRLADPREAARIRLDPQRQRQIRLLTEKLSQITASQIAAETKKWQQRNDVQKGYWPDFLNGASITGQMLTRIYRRAESDAYAMLTPEERLRWKASNPPGLQSSTKGLLQKARPAPMMRATTAIAD